MIEITSRLFIGSQNDYEATVRFQLGWNIVHACKEPYHRQALGYTGRAAPKTHPEYLIARRDNRLILNMVDADDPAYIPHEIVDATLEFVRIALSQTQNVLIHCNQGLSRAPTLGWLYLMKHTNIISTTDFEEAEKAFRALYPLYTPARGVYLFARLNWEKYLKSA